MKKSIHILLFFFSIASHAQEIYILDESTMEPIVGVTVYSNLENSVFSDFDGKVLLDSFENDEVITFKHLSYQTKLINKQTIENTVLLSMKTQSLDQIIISASRFAQDIKEIPQRILQINKEGLAISNPQTSAD